MAIRDGNDLQDEKLKALSEFSSAMLNKRGRPDREDVSRFLDVGYSDQSKGIECREIGL